MDFWFFLAIFELMSDSLTTTQVEPNQCASHQSILLTQGPICEILATIAQLLGVVEKLSFFESAILIFFFLKKNFFFASFLFKLVTIYGVPRIFWNFDDYLDFQKNQGGYRLMKHTVGTLKMFEIEECAWAKIFNQTKLRDASLNLLCKNTLSKIFFVHISCLELTLKFF